MERKLELCLFISKVVISIVVVSQKHSSLLLNRVNYKRNRFCSIASQNFFLVNLLTLFCKLDYFTNWKIFLSVLWKDLAYKRVSKFSPKKFYEIGPWSCFMTEEISHILISLLENYRLRSSATIYRHNTFPNAPTITRLKRTAPLPFNRVNVLSGNSHEASKFRSF